MMQNVLSENLISRSLLRRELSAYARDRRSQLLFAIAVAVAASATFLNYAYGASTLTRIAGRLGSGSALFDFLGVLQIVFGVGVIPHLVVRWMAGERARGELMLLRSALLNGRCIVLTRFIAACAYGALFTFVVAPFYGFVMLLGGVDAMEMVAVAVIGFASTALAVSAALHMGASSASAGQALVGTMVFSAMLLIGLPLIVAFISAAVQEIVGPLVRSTGPSLATDGLEAAIGLLESLGPLSALRSGRAAYAASGDAWTHGVAVFTMMVRVLLPAPFLTLAATHLPSALVLLRAAAQRVEG